MRLSFKITDAMLERCRTDLHRPHEFAFERVAFLITKTAWSDSRVVVLAYDYVAIPDEQYVYDPSVGARISQESVRNALNHALLRKCGVFHVHSHHFGRMLWFSETDLVDQDQMIPDFFSVSPNQVHGSLLIGGSTLTGRPWLKRNTPAHFADLQVIGQRMRSIWPRSNGQTEFLL